MNRRQRKKQFKRIYGMNPKQYEKWMQKHWPEILKQRAENGAEAIREGFKRLGEMVKEAAQIFSESLSTWAEEIQAAAGFQETDNMLRKSNLLPEGTDKELLKHIGIRMDRYGWAYDFYMMKPMMSILWRFCRKEGLKMGTMWMILKMLGMGCLIVAAAIVLIILIALMAAVVKSLIEKK